MPGKEVDRARIITHTYRLMPASAAVSSHATTMILQVMSRAAVTIFASRAGVRLGAKSGLHRLNLGRRRVPGPSRAGNKQVSEWALDPVRRQD